MEGGAKGKTSGMLDAAVDKFEEVMSSRREEREEAPRRRPRQRSREEDG
jgi:hypothetical protein